MNKKHNREDILEKGEELIRQRGFNKTGVEEIINACGVPKGTFYNYFKSKEDFGADAVKHYAARHYQSIKELLGKTKISPTNRLKSFYKSSIEFNVSENFANGCLIGNMINEMGGVSEKITRATDSSLKQIIRLIKNTIKEGQNAGEIRSDYTAAELANYVHNSFYGALMRAKSATSRVPLETFMKISFEFLKVR